jgi:hypothetical protein
MTATEQREIAAIERARVATMATREDVSKARALELRKERLRTLRTLLLLRHEATRGRDGASPREWYIRQVSRVTWAMDGKAGR